ncbi:hypothetical protein HHI36_001733 [Cryptolaemus montrouzieri]|uniref:Uncharacterized protein n=1 Tax=Cryptolaemus montrouzieri TaxID=559131 RepID=A0ABD2P988_9CUCU
MRVNIEIGSRVFRHEVIAADITEEVILGMDVIKRNDVLKVHLCEDVTLPSLSETVVMARHDGNMEKVSTCLMEPCVDSPLGKGLAVGKILVKMKENVPVRILNVNSFPVTLKRDTVIAENDDKTGKTDIVRHKINTGDSQPIRQHPRRLPLAKEKKLKR